MRCLHVDADAPGRAGERRSGNHAGSHPSPATAGIVTCVGTPAAAIIAISKFTGAQGFEQPFGTQMAAGVVVTVPLVIAVLIFQRRIVAGLTAGGVK